MESYKADFIVEGIADAEVLRQFRDVNPDLPIGDILTAGSVGEIFETCKSAGARNPGNLCVVAMDRDIPGWLAAEKCSRELGTKTLCVPDGKDLCEFRSLEGPEAVHAIVENALEGFDGTSLQSFSAVIPLQDIKRQLFLSFPEILAKAKAPEFLVAALIERGSFVIVFGESGSYKSFFATELGFCVAAGISFHGFQVKKSAVFFVCGEGVSGFNRRIKGLNEHYKPDSEVLLWGTQHEVFFDDPEAARVAYDEVLRIVERTGVRPGLIVVDTLARNLQGDENSAEEMNRFIGNLSRFLSEEFGDASVLVIHHPGHADKSRERGSYSLRGAVDVRYRISRQEGTDLEATLECLKMKDADEVGPFAIKLKTTPTGLIKENGGDVTTLRIDSIERTKIIPMQKAKQKDAAFRSLERALEKYGERRSNIVGAVKCVEENRWREQCSEDCLSHSRNEDGQDKAFRRAKKNLLRKDLIGSKSGYCWIIYPDA